MAACTVDLQWCKLLILTQKILKRTKHWSKIALKLYEMSFKCEIRLAWFVKWESDANCSLHAKCSPELLSIRTSCWEQSKSSRLYFKVMSLSFIRLDFVWAASSEIQLKLKTRPALIGQREQWEEPEELGFNLSRFINYLLTILIIF